MKNIIIALFAMAIQTLNAQTWQGAGTQGNPYQIRTVQDLADLATNVSIGNNYAGVYFQLMNDLDLNVAPWNTGEGWIPIGRKVGVNNYTFNGIFDGNGKTISNLYIYRNTNTSSYTGIYQGLFGFIGGNCTIENLGLLNARVWALSYVGSLVGATFSNTCAVSNCYSKNVDIGGFSDVYGGSGFGGLMGYFEGLVTNCYSTGIVSYGGISGGLGGTVNGNINNCWSSAELPKGGGGLIGYFYGTMSNCYATGNVNGGGGGLVNSAGSGHIIDCYSTGNVDSGGDGAGGLAGTCYAKLTRCYALGHVTGGFRVGGLAGEAGAPDIENCFAAGNVKGNMWVGGLVGQYGYGTIKNSYAVGNVEGGNGLGGLIGNSHSESVVSQCWAAGKLVQSRVHSNYTDGTPGGIGGTSGSFGGLVGSALDYYAARPAAKLERSAVAISSIDYIYGTWGVVTGYSGTLTRNIAYNGMTVNRMPVNAGNAGNGVTLTTIDELRTKAVYSGGLLWTDFDEHWVIWEGASFPYFNWQSAPVRIDECTISGISGGVRPGATVDRVAVYRDTTGDLIGEAALSGVNWSLSCETYVGEGLRVIVFETGKAPSYPIYVKASDPLGLANADAGLSSLTLSEGTLTPAFTTDVTNYTVEVPNGVNAITISAAATAHPLARITGTGLKQLRVGDNRHVIEVAAQNNDTKKYMVNIIRAATPQGLYVSGVALIPSKAVVRRGATQTFDAVILATGGSSTAATWSVSGANSEATTINQYGILTVASGETAATLTITATSVADGSKSGVATVTLTNEVLPPAVTRFEVVPSPINVHRGGSTQLVADISVQGGVTGIVSWEVVGEDPKGSAQISASGLLTVRADERWNIFALWTTFSYDGSRRMYDVWVYDPPSVTEITLYPASINIEKGQTHQFSTYVYTKGDACTAVEWSVSGATSAATRISEKGVLTVGADEGAMSLTVRATSVFDNTKFKTATVAVPNVASVAVSPASSGVAYGSARQFTANVTATAGVSKDVAWEVTGNTSPSTVISSLGLLSVAADETAESLTVTAVSWFDPAKKGNALVNTGGVAITVSPSEATVQKGKTRQFIATVTTTGAATGGVAWSRSGNSLTTTTINATTGLLTVNINEGAATLTITATSTFDNTKTAFATVTLTSDGVSSVTVSPSSVSLFRGAEGATQQFDATVTVTGPAATQEVVWTVTGTGKSPETIISETGLLTVSHAETANTLTVRATSGFDNTQYGTATVTLQRVNSVTVSPATANVQRGATRQFSATVNVSGGASTAVEWTVSGNESAETTISEEGLLTIAENEPAGTLTVTATSILDNTKSGFATVTVPTVTTVTVTPNPATAERGKSVQFTATVTAIGGASTAVTWNVSGTELTGTYMYNNWLYIAEGETAETLTVTATSTFDNSKHGSATVTVIEPIAVTNVTVSPSSVSLAKGGTQQFTADVTTTGGASEEVTWSITGHALLATTISESGLLTIAAGETSTYIYVTATSIYDQYQYGIATVTIEPPGITAVTVTPATATVAKGDAEQFTANVTAAGGASTAVEWTVTGNESQETVVSADGLLSVAADETASTLTVTATSVFDNTKKGVATVTVPGTVSSVMVTPATATVRQDRTQQFTATVTATGGVSTAVTWTVAGNESASTGINTSGLLAVSAGETAETLVVTATSVYDYNKKGTATVTVEKIVTGAEIDDTPLVRIYPNPTDDAVTLEFKAQGVYHLSLADMTGKVLLRQTVKDQIVRINLSNYPADVYLLTIDDGVSKSTTRIVKN